jgi:hypothetical protein
MPPGEGVGYVLRIRAEIMIYLVTKVRFRRGGKCWQIVKDVLR